MWRWTSSADRPAIGRPLHDRAAAFARLTGRYAVLIVGLWVLAAGAANLVVPQLERVVDSHSRAFMAADAPSSVPGAARANQVRTAIKEATKEGTLAPTAIELAGVGPVTTDLQRLVARDTSLLVGAALVLIFIIVTAMLRTPVAGLVVVGTVVASYASALGASVLIWQHLLHHELHWAVAPIAFIALIAVGADYNLLLTLRIKQEATAGLRTGIIRAFGGTGGVVTVAGIVFGLTMLALLSSSVLSIAQIGTTIAVGLLLDTLVVRAFIVPSIVALLGRWFWWPREVPRPPAVARAEVPQPQPVTEPNLTSA